MTNREIPIIPPASAPGFTGQQSKVDLAMQKDEIPVPQKLVLSLIMQPENGYTAVNERASHHRLASVFVNPFAQLFVRIFVSPYVVDCTSADALQPLGSLSSSSMALAATTSQYAKSL